MSAASALRYSRRRSGLTQRALSSRSGVPQATIARIESGKSEPRFALLQRLLRSCGQQLAVEDLSGIGIDRTVIRELLELTPRQRLEWAAEEARNVAALENAVTSVRRPEEAG